MKLHLIILASGAAVMSLELAASRLFAPYFGSSIFVWGSLIGVILSALALGYHIGGRAADRKASRKLLSRILLASGVLVLFIPALAAALLPILKAMGQTYGPLVAASLLMGGPAILMGMVTPYALRLQAKEIRTLGRTAGNLYSLSTVGSIAGTFITTFVLIPYMGVTTIIYSLGLLLLSASFLTSKERITVLVIIVSLLLFPGFLIRVNNALTFALDDISYRPVYETDSAYYHITVAEDRATGNKLVLFMDNLKHSSMYRDRPNETTFRYPYYFHGAFAFNPDIREVLFIGGGGMSSPKNFLQEYPEIDIDVVEIDPTVVKIAKEYFAVPDDPRLEIHVGDGRVFLEESSKKYDLIVLDAYSSTYVPFHLMTLEFFQLAKDHLDEDGVLAFNLITPIEGSLASLFRSEYKTIDSVFRDVHVIPLSVTTIPGNVILLATDTEKKQESEYLEKAYEGKIDTLGVPLFTDDYAPVNEINPLLGKPFLESETED